MDWSEVGRFRCCLRCQDSVIRTGIGMLTSVKSASVYHSIRKHVQFGVLEDVYGTSGRVNIEGSERKSCFLLVKRVLLLLDNGLFRQQITLLCISEQVRWLVWNFIGIFSTRRQSRFWSQQTQFLIFTDSENFCKERSVVVDFLNDGTILL